MNTSNLLDLLNLAQGTRSLSQYARESGIAPSTLSRIKKSTDSQLATPKTLEKLAEHALNNVTYEALMTACGYSHENPKTATVIDFYNLLEMDNSSFTLNGEVLSDEAIDSIKQALHMGIELATLKNKQK